VASIKLVPFGKIPQDILDAIFKELRKSMKMYSDITSTMELPNEAYNPLRHQYVANTLMEVLEKKFFDRILAITKEDIYSEDLNFIFGQAQVKGKIALVSIARLNPVFYSQPNDQELLVRRAVKESIHEIGHLLGLAHCKTLGCVMNFSNTVINVDRKTKNFCTFCQRQLGI